MNALPRASLASPARARGLCVRRRSRACRYGLTLAAGACRPKAVHATLSAAVSHGMHQQGWAGVAAGTGAEGGGAKVAGGVGWPLGGLVPAFVLASGLGAVAQPGGAMAAAQPLSVTAVPVVPSGVGLVQTVAGAAEASAARAIVSSPHDDGSSSEEHSSGELSDSGGIRTDGPQVARFEALIAAKAQGGEGARGCGAPEGQAPNGPSASGSPDTGEEVWEAASVGAKRTRSDDVAERAAHAKAGREAPGQLSAGGDAGGADPASQVGGGLGGGVGAAGERAEELKLSDEGGEAEVEGVAATKAKAVQGRMDGSHSESDRESDGGAERDATTRSGDSSPENGSKAQTERCRRRSKRGADKPRPPSGRRGAFASKGKGGRASK